MTRFLALAALAFIPAAGAAEEKFFLQDGQRVVFLGDSNTYAHLYVSYIDAYLVTRFPDQRFDVLNLGLPSENVSGLSEPDHPFPRPNLHDRLARVLEKTKPNVVVACYGMNDGIYYPFADERFKRYQEGIERLVQQCEKAGAKVVLLTPPSFDPRPLKDKVQDKTAEKFSWLKPYRDYDDVLKCYSDWLLTLREKHPVIDVHGPMDRFLEDGRKKDEKFYLSGDGIHFDATGHAIIALQVLEAWHAPAVASEAAIDAENANAAAGDLADVKVDKGVVQFTWKTKVPMPADPAWNRTIAEQIGKRLNRFRLTITGAKAAKYELFEGDTRLGVVARDDLATGLDLLGFKDLSANRRSAELWDLVDQRQKLLGLAWLTDVGHKRPDMPKGEPLDEARKKAEKLGTRIRELALPVAMHLRLKPVEP
jgi:lysophospholipase L1-like esterase